MACNMKAKFEKYWSEDTMVLAFGAILDPSKKLDFVQCLYEEVDPFYVEKVKQIQMNLYRLYDEYVNKDDQSNESLSQVHASSSLGGGNEKKFQVPLYQARFEQHKNTKRITSRGKSELDIYLEADPEQIPQNVCFDVLSYWKDRSCACPTLSKMACDILSIPITTVTSESAFSIDARVLNKYRSSLNDETVQALLCTRSWLHGFVEYDNKEDDDERDVIDIEDVKLSHGGLESIVQ
ncbi:PREDICTED: zinc finger BED domain-containing protein DAYSLEEPER-like [Lupinus angustifolius]|uniref:zinc finger BED domain-containing protein DAYSLEEPER-like n=1 Tax=Lupinus angustifolius TaxID=3871 RepID=UPI00092F7DA8|nr:PREDICTED: zinc finger BED domain-containing protein DAYSLEEPER-like [Lupinus angustifolius]